MKILQLVKFYHPSEGGMESVVKCLSEGLAQHADVTVYSNNHNKTNQTEDFTYNGVRVYKEATPFLFRSQPITFYYKRLAKAIEDHELVHYHYPFPTVEFNLLFLLKKLRGKKLVITWHANVENSRWRSFTKVYGFFTKLLLDRADCVVVTSPQLLEHSSILRDYQDKIEVIPLSFSSRFTSTATRTYPEGRRATLLFVGKLREYKGVNYLIRAIQDLDVELKIVGQGEEKDSLIQLAEDCGVSDRTHFYEYVTDEELVRIYRSSDLFVLPSVNESEAFGVVQLEAMSTGLPVINTALKSGVPFVSLHGESGLTVEPRNVAALAGAIKEILANKGVYEKFSQQALDRSLLFSNDVMVSSYSSLYKRLLSEISK